MKTGMKTSFDVLIEAAKADPVITDNLFDEDIESQFVSVYDGFDDMECCNYTEESTPIFDNNGIYVVEADILGKFMEASEITDPIEAMNRLAEHYDIPLNKMGLLFESAEDASEFLSEAKSSKKKLGDVKKLGVVKATTDLAKKAKENGIKLFKKKGKKCSKKKGKC